MKNCIRTLRQEQNLVLWSKQVEACNSSGLSVTQWCKENNIPVSTYWNRQRKVFESFTERSEKSFVEVSVQPEIKTTDSVVVTINSGNFTVDIHSGADEDTITAVLRAMKNA